MQAYEIKQLLANNFMRVYDRYVELKRCGGHWRGRCPIHQGDGLNFTVNDTGLWFCHSQCQAGGDALDFIKLIEKCGFREAIQMVVKFYSKYRIY